MRRLWALGLAIAAAVAGAGAAGGPEQAVPRQPPQQTAGGEYTREQAEFVTERLYAALLGRAPDEIGRAQSVAEIQRGNLQRQVEAMTRSMEFRQRILGRAAGPLLEEYYRALLGRSPDTSGVRAHLGDVEAGRHAEVVYRVVTSPEFEATVPGRAVPGPAPGRGGSDASRVVLACQDAVLEAAAAQTSRLLLRFAPGGATTSSRTAGVVRGRAVDVLAGDRPLSYRCDVDMIRQTVTRATYTWDDGLGDGSFPVAVVRACHDAVREEIRRDRGRRDIVFETAGLLPLGGSAEAVRGRAREVAAFGSGSRLEYACEVSRGRVESATYRYVR